jgi:hypothetical protein
MAEVKLILPGLVNHESSKSENLGYISQLIL